MKRSLVFFFLCLPASAWGAFPNLVNTSTGTSAATTSLAITISAPTNGNALILHCGIPSSTNNRITSVAETGSTWTIVAATSDIQFTGLAEDEIWYAPNVQSAGTTVTVNLAASLAVACNVFEYSGIKLSSAVDVTASAHGGDANVQDGSQPQTGTTATTSQPIELWFGGVMNSGKATGGGGTNPTNGFTYIAQNSIGAATFVDSVHKSTTTTGTAGSVLAYGGSIPITYSYAGNVATFMSSNTITTAISSPTTCVDSAGIGTVVWTTPSNAQLADLVLTSAAINNVASATDASVRLVNAAGSLVGTDKADLVTNWATYPAVSTVTYGSSTDTWASGVTYTDVQSANFGIKLAAQQLSAPTTSHFLYCSSYTFVPAVPNCATINGVQATVRKNGQATKSLLGDTLVDTPRGKIRLMELRTGDNVYGWDGQKLVIRRIAQIKNKEDPEVILVRTKSGEITGTPEHIFYTADGLKPLSAMNLGTVLRRRDGKDEPITMIMRKKGRYRTYEVFFSDEPHNYFANGYLVHNVTVGDAEVDIIWMAVTYTLGTCPSVGGGVNMQSRRSKLEE